MSNQDKIRQDESLLTELGIEPYTLITDVLKNVFFIILGSVAVMMFALVIASFRYEPNYTTKATFVVSSKDMNNSYGNLNSANRMATTMEKILESTVMEKKICEVLGIDMENFDAKISTSVVEGTNLLELSVTANNPKEAIDIIRTIMDNYTEVSLYAISNAVMDVLQQPAIPYSPDNPLSVRSIAKKGFLLGALIWIFLFGLNSYLGNTIKQENEIELKLDAKSMGSIPYEAKKKTITSVIGRKNKKALLVDDPMCGFSFVENYKKLVSKAEYNMQRKGKKILVVTSVSENEGKSTVAANIALSLSLQGHKVVLVDGDIRRPSQFLIFGLKPDEKQEIGEYLNGNVEMNDIIMKTGRKGLFFIGGRSCYASSTEMLHTERLKLLFDKLRDVADFVIVDTPPAGIIGDSQVFAHHADSVLLVAKQNMVLAEDINDVIDDFRDSHSDVMGVVLNAVRSAGSMKITGYGVYGRYGNYKNYAQKKGSRK